MIAGVGLGGFRQAVQTQSLLSGGVGTGWARRSLFALVPAVTILMAVAFVSVRYGVPTSLMTRDTTSVAGVHPFIGVLSNLGVLLWCVAGSTCAFAATVLRRSGSGETFRFLLCSAFLSCYLLFDDFFLFHEDLANRLLGFSEKTVYILLGVAVLVYLASFAKIILRTNVGSLALSFAFLGTSVVVDGIIEPWLWRLGHWESFIEDGAKWLGIVFWCVYCVETSFQAVAKATEASDRPVRVGQTVSRG